MTGINRQIATRVHHFQNWGGGIEFDPSDPVVRRMPRNFLSAHIEAKPKGKVDQTEAEAHLCIDAQGVSDQKTEPARVEVGTGADHAVRGQPRDLPGAVGQDVHGV